VGQERLGPREQVRNLRFFGEFAVALPGCRGAAHGYNRPQYIAAFAGLPPRRSTNPMKRANSLLHGRWRLPALAFALCASSVAHADDYAEVSRLLRTGQGAEALARADQYLASKPRDPQMRFIRGVVLSETGRAADALAVFSQLTLEHPELPEPYNNLAVLHAAQGELGKARDALEAAVRANPAYAVAHENLGDVYARLAAQSYDRALHLEPARSSLQAKLTLVRQLFTPAGAQTGVRQP
jgi:Flp pilus assembly protein TadD